MTVGAPKDPLFYTDLEAFGQRTGAKPEDALYVWSSESGLDSTLSGNSRTFSTLMHYVAVPKYMSEEVWQRLPSMSHREQLQYVEQAIFAPAHRILGRPFNSTFEVYLANAASGLLRPDGVYSEQTPMYVGQNYPDNWTLDNYPAGVGAYYAWAQSARAQGISPTLRGAYGVAQDLIGKGVLKGYVSLGDLKSFAKGLLQRGAVIANDAITNLNAVRSNVAQGRPPSLVPPVSPPQQLAARAPTSPTRTAGLWDDGGPEIEWAEGVDVLEDPWMREDGAIVDGDYVVGFMREPTHVAGFDCPSGWDLITGDSQIGCAYHKKTTCLAGETTPTGMFHCTDWDVPACPPGMTTHPGSPKNWCFPIGSHTVGRAEPYPTGAARLAAAASASKYAPDFDSPFRPNAPPDTRIATPEKARSSAPSSLVVHAENLATGREGPPFLKIGLWVAGAALVTTSILIIATSASKKGT